MQRLFIALLTVLGIVPGVWAWGAHVHRVLTYVALDALPPDAPAWLRDPAVHDRAAFHSNQPDRWRGWDSPYLKHENDPDHYLDVELLAQLGLTLETVPKLRGEYLRVMAVAKATHPQNVAPYDPSQDPARLHEWPGFVLHAVMEHYAKLQAALDQVRILERLNDPARQMQLEEARSIAIYHVGQLSHFVADIAQPLHTTKHYNGWIGENPAGYKWRDKFHAYIDEGWSARHGVDRPMLAARVKRDVRVNAGDPWDDVLAYLRRSHAQMQPLYALERDGQLDGPEGEKLLLGQLDDAASMLAALIEAACTSAEPTQHQIESWTRYEGSDAPPPAPATAPGTQPSRPND